MWVFSERIYLRENKKKTDDELNRKNILFDKKICLGHPLDFMTAFCIISGKILPA